MYSQLGQNIDGENAGDNSGRSVSISSNGNTVAIGGWYNVTEMDKMQVMLGFTI